MAKKKTETRELKQSSKQEMFGGIGVAPLVPKNLQLNYPKVSARVTVEKKK